MFRRTNTTRLWQPQLFTILENFDPADHNLTAEHSSTFCEILDLSTVANGTFAATAGNATCTNVGKSNTLQPVFIAAFRSIFDTNRKILCWQNSLMHFEFSRSSSTTPFTWTRSLYPPSDVSFFCWIAFYWIYWATESYCVSVWRRVFFFLQKLVIPGDTIADISYGVAFVCIIGLYWSSEILVTLILTSFFIGLTNTTQNIIIAATVIMFPTSLRLRRVDNIRQR